MKRVLKVLGYTALALAAILAVTAAGLFAREQVVVARAQQAIATAVAPAAAGFDLGTTETLRITPLYEAAAQGELAAGRGVSYLIETDAATVLLDAGFTDTGATVLAGNMAALGVRLDDVDAFVLSHPHFDHMGGIAPWRQMTVRFGGAQPDWGGRPFFGPEPLTYPGATPVTATEAQAIAPGVATIGTIPFEDVFPLSLITPVRHEQALVVNVAGVGPVLITGCGHPGLEALTQRAEALFGLPIAGVVGGLHYMGADAAAVQPHIDFLAARNPVLVALSPHDSGAAARAAFAAAFPDTAQELAVGKPIVVGAQ